MIVAQSLLWDYQVSVKKMLLQLNVTRFIVNEKYLVDIKKERKRTKEIDRKKEQFQIMFVKKILKVI